MLVAFRRWDEVCRLEMPSGLGSTRVCQSVDLVRAAQADRGAGRGSAAARPSLEVAELGYDDGVFWAAVRRLPRRQAQCIALVIRLRLPGGRSRTVLGCAEGTVKAHLARGRTRLACPVGRGTNDGSQR